MATIQEAMTIAIRHHQGGRLQEAEQIYRQVIDHEPNHADAIHLLGLLAHQAGKHEIAMDSIRRAIGIRGNVAVYHDNLGMVYLAMHRASDAEACFRRAFELMPESALTHSHLGMALKELGKLDEAITSYRRALALQPKDAGTFNNLGLALKDQGKLDEAVASYRRALELNSKLVQAHSNLGVACRDLGRLDESVASLRRAIELDPNFAHAHNNLGAALKDQGKLAEAGASFRRAIALRPSEASAYNNLGIVLRELGKLDEAVASYRRALELRPDFASAHNNLGNALNQQGRMHDAIASYRRAIQYPSEIVNAYSNLLYCLVFCDGYDAEAILEEHRPWDRQVAQPLARLIRPHPNDRSPDRRLRIGYVSPDFRDHAESFFTVPLLASHDHQDFEIYCYSDVLQSDSMTTRLRSYADVWRDITGLNDDRVAELIRQDGIDVLVDLTMHMARNRLLVFARKPAPVQACWLAYQGTTGLSTMDYRITDPHIDPPGLFDPYYAEESIRLPDAFWCYDPLDSETRVAGLPVRENGQITFGCLNNFCKVNASVLKLWARVLRAVDRSRLLILSGEGSHRQEAAELLESEGVPRDRVSFVGRIPRIRYLELYHGIDIGLDTFPYTGQTTSLDAFWMGVPVVTIVGQTAASRAGRSLLVNLGLPELIAETPEEFVSIAADLAHDLPRLADLRATLRDRLRASPLMDAPRFARNMEAAYREMWRKWCAR
jgi:predicted O-linked N-acetylglucosamine transferase (SPINDLY family)